MYTWRLRILQNYLLRLSILDNICSYTQNAFQVCERDVLMVALSAFRRISSNMTKMLLLETLQLTLHAKPFICFNDQ
jgi:hypothetical protein